MEIKPASPPSPADLTPAAPGRSPEINATQAEQVIGWIKSDLEKKLITPEQAKRSFDEIDAPVEARQPDTRTDEVKELDTAFPIAKGPEEYSISYGQNDMTPELKQFDTTARTWLHAAEFPRELGTTLAKTIDEVTRGTASMNEDQLIEFGNREFSKLQHLYGDGLTERLQQAGRMVEILEAKQPGLKQLLKSRGIGDSARVATLLMDQAERFWRRHK